MRQTYKVLGNLIALLVVVQAGVIAFGVFGIFKDVEDGGVVDKDYRNLGMNLHGAIGMGLIPILALALLIVSFFVALPGGVRWAGIVVGLVVLQIALLFVAFPVPALGALHGINAFLVAGAAARAARLANTPVPAAPAPVPA